MQDKDQFIDELLDSALAHQPGAEPRAGIEGRILSHVRAATKQSSRTRLWLASAATAAALVMFLAIFVERRSHQPAVQSPQVSKAAPLIQPKETLSAKIEPAPKAGTAPTSIATKRTAHRDRKPSHGVEARHWPSQFPTPAPLSPEEKTLVQYVRETPSQILAEPILKAEFTVQHVEIKPLEIPPLEIKPLTEVPAKEEIQ